MKKMFTSEAFDSATAVELPDRRVLDFISVYIDASGNTVTILSPTEVECNAVLAQALADGSVAAVLQNCTDAG